MTKKAKVLLTVATVFTVIALIALSVAVPLLLEYFRLTALPPADSVSQGISQGAGAAFSLVFFLIFAMASGGCCVISLITGIFAYRSIPKGKASYFALAIVIFSAVDLLALGVAFLWILLQ